MRQVEIDLLKQAVEAIIFASDTPISFSQIKTIVEEADVSDIQKAVEALNLEYAQTNRSFHIVQLAGGFQMITRESYAPWIKKLFQGRLKTKLSQAALETLSVIAFKQPISKTEIEGIRGVNCDAVVRTLMERKLVEISGRANTPGRPLIYKTTKEFLRYFGINDVNDLPMPREIDELLKEDQPLTENAAE